MPKQKQSFWFWCSECGNELTNDDGSTWFEEDLEWPEVRRIWVKCGICAVTHIGSLDIAPVWIEFGKNIPFKIGYP